MRLSTERQFGTLFTLIFLVVTFLSFKKSMVEIFYVALCSTVFLAVITVANGDILKKLSHYWHKFGVLYSKVNNPIVFGLLFFIFLTPFAIFMRAFNRDELRILPRETDSYWLKHDKIEYDLDSFRNQY